MKSKFSEFSYAWRIVVASALGIGLGLSPIPIYTLGVFAQPLAMEFGWTIGQIFTAMVILTLCSLVLSPLVGLIIDRIGVRKVAVASVLGFGLGLMLHALNPGSFTLYLVTWAVVAFLGVGTLPITWTRVINNWFSDCRGLALGCSLVATGLFGIFAKFYVAYLIDVVGWRLAFVGLGMVPILVALPVAFFLFRDIDDPKISEDKKPAFAQGAAAGVKTGMSRADAFKDWRFWMLCGCFVVISFGVGGIIPNLENLFSSKGFDRNQAVLLASFVGWSVIMGRLAGGFLIDRFWAPAVAFCLLILPALSCYFLSQGELTFAFATVAVLLVGLAAGAEQDLMAFLVARYFGLKNYGVIYGLMYASFALGAGFAPAIVANVYDATQTYDTVLGYVGFAFLAGAVPLLLLGKYRDFSS